MIISCRRAFRGRSLRTQTLLGKQESILFSLSLSVYPLFFLSMFGFALPFFWPLSALLLSLLPPPWTDKGCRRCVATFRSTQRWSLQQIFCWRWRRWVWAGWSLADDPRAYLWLTGVASAHGNMIDALKVEEDVSQSTGQETTNTPKTKGQLSCRTEPELKCMMTITTVYLIVLCSLILSLSMFDYFCMFSQTQN